MPKDPTRQRIEAKRETLLPALRLWITCQIRLWDAMRAVEEVLGSDTELDDAEGRMAYLAAGADNPDQHPSDEDLLRAIESIVKSSQAMRCYSLCKYCDFFVEFVVDPQTNQSTTRHARDGDFDPDEYHAAVSRGQFATMDHWVTQRPDLFITHEDGHVGPNSLKHKTLLPVKPGRETE